MASECAIDNLMELFALHWFGDVLLLVSLPFIFLLLRRIWSVVSRGWFLEYRIPRLFDISSFCQLANDKCNAPNRSLLFESSIFLTPQVFLLNPTPRLLFFRPLSAFFFLDKHSGPRHRLQAFTPSLLSFNRARLPHPSFSLLPHSYLILRFASSASALATLFYQRTPLLPGTTATQILSSRN